MKHFPAAWILLLVLTLHFPMTGLGQVTEEQPSIESAREALGGYNGFPWYDEEKDSIQRIDVKAPADALARKSKWVYQPVNWTFPQWLGYLLEAFGWLLLALAIAFVTFALVKAFGLAEFGSPGSRGDQEDSLRGDIDRVEALPFQLQRPQSDLLGEARRYFDAGDYGQAMIYLYSYQLIQLDRHHFIRLTKGKTNRQYLREIRSHRELWTILRTSMIAFEDVFFGHHTLERERIETCWNQLHQFHELLEPVPA